MTGVALVLLAIATPLDTYAGENLSAHMAQHEVLTLAAPPLLLLGAPIWPLWRAFPLRWRRAVLRQVVRRSWLRRVGSGAWWLIRHPIAAWVVFMVVFLGWHIPPLYNFALEHTAAHALEHIMFLLIGLLFWAQIIPSFPLKPTLGYLQRAGFLFAASMVLHVVAVLFAVDVQPIYPYYGTGDAAVAAQMAAGGIMDICGQVVFTVAILVCLGYWLHDEERSGEPAHAAPDMADMAPSPQGILLLSETEYAETDHAKL